MGFIEFIVVVIFGIFAYAKITEKGDIARWSWWKVTSPLWIYAIFALVVYGLVLGLIGIFLSTPAGF